MLMLSVQSGIGFQGWGNTEVYAQSDRTLVESSKSVARTVTHPGLQFNDKVVANITETITWHPNGTTSISDDRGNRFDLHIPLDNAKFTLLSNFDTIVQRVEGPDFQYDVYWVPIENEDGVTEKYKFTIIGSSANERELKFAVETDKGIVSDGNKFIVTDRASSSDTVNSTATGILSDASGTANSTALESILSNGTSSASVNGVGLDWSDAIAAGYDMSFDPASNSLNVKVGKSFIIDPVTSIVVNTVQMAIGYSSNHNRVLVMAGGGLFSCAGTFYIIDATTHNLVSSIGGICGSGVQNGPLGINTDHGQVAVDEANDLAFIATIDSANLVTRIYKFDLVTNTLAGERIITYQAFRADSSSCGLFNYYPFGIISVDGDLYVAMQTGDNVNTDCKNAQGIVATIRGLVKINPSNMAVVANYTGFTGRGEILRSGILLAGIGGDIWKFSTSSGNATLLTNIGGFLRGVDVYSGNIYIADENSDSVEVISSSTGSPVASISLTGDPWGVAVNSGADKLYVTERAANAVVELDATDFTVLHTFTHPSMNQPAHLVTVPSLGKVFIQNAAGNSVTVITPDTTDDFELSSMESVQAIFNHNILAENKATVLRLDVNSAFSTTVNNVKITLTYGSPEAGMTTMDEFVSIEPGMRSLYLPADSTILPTGSEFSASAQIDPDNVFPESSEVNNMLSASSLPLKDTQPLDILFVPLRLPGDTSPACPLMLDFSSRNTQYIEAIYPVSEQESSSRPSCVTFEPALGLFGGTVTNYFWAQITRELDTLTWFSEYDKVVGVVRTDWFATKTNAAVGVKGAALPGVDGAIVEVQVDTGPTVAHELAHTYGWVSGSYPEEDPGGDRHLILMKAPGFWIDKRCEMGWYYVYPPDPHCIPESEIPADKREFSPYELMHFDVSNPASSDDAFIADAWISFHTYNFLLDKLKVNSFDPPVIGIGGVIFENNTTILSPWYRFNSTLDIGLNNTGEFRILYQNALNQTIGEMGFDLDSEGFEETGELGVGAVSLRIPDLAGTTKIVIKRVNQTLAERIITVASPLVNVTGPNGGEAFAHGQNITVTWQSSDLDGGELTHVVSISQDGGLTWIPLAVEITGNQFSFVATTEIVSDEVLFKVLASDGINTGEDVSDAPSTIQGARTEDMFLHATGPIANPSNLFLNGTGPTATIAKYKDSAGINFAGGNQWKQVGTWPTSSPPLAGTLSDVGNLTFWLGLKNSDDIGTRFDLRAEVYRDSDLVASGQTHCITGLVRNPANAKEVTVSFDTFPPEDFDGTDNLSVKILTRIGTNPDNTFCGGHSNAAGLRLYFDSVSRPSMFNATFT